MDYTTNDLSKILDVTTNTIRRYEKMGYLSAERNESNGYRKFSHTDVEKLMHVAKYRKVGFSHEDINEILQEDKDTIVERFKRKKEELDEQIRHLQALSHMLKDDILLMNRVEEYGPGVFEYECSPFHYVLYQKRGKLCATGKQAEALHHFMSTCAEFEYLYLFEQADIEARRMVYSEGVGANQRCTAKYNVNTEFSEVKSYERRPCVLKFMRVPLDFKERAGSEPEALYELVFGDMHIYMDEHDLASAGDALALKIGYSKEEDKEWQYVLLHLPVKPKKANL